MKITAADVNKLRKQTGAGMMDCKNALVEAEGNVENAVDILRKKGQKIAAKRADRDAAEGCVLAQANADNSKGFIISLNCETDFVAKNDGFVTLAQEIMNVVVEGAPSDLDALKALNINGMTIGEKLIEQTGVIGEKLEIGSFELVEASFVASYIHAGNRLATIVGLSSNPAEAAVVGRDVAMQVAAMNPLAVSKDGIDQATIDREIEVAKEQIRQEGKPEAMLEKIAMGKLNKFFKDNTLLPQAFIKDSKKSVAQYLEGAEKGLTVTVFKRVGLGV